MSYILYFPITVQRKIRFPGHCLMLEGWQGPPHINKVKQIEIVLSFRVSLLIKFKQNEDLFPLIKMSSPKPHSAPSITKLCHFPKSCS